MQILLDNNDDFGPKRTLTFFTPVSQARSVRFDRFLYNKMRIPGKVGGLLTTL